MRRCIHVVYINDFFPELWKLTFPTIKAYADRIGADLNVITERLYNNDVHINYEKMQVWYAGADYDANFLVDADVLIHQHFPDFTTIVPQHHVGFNDNYNASVKFAIEDNIYFQRDGRDVGIASNAVVTYKSTHDLWTPNSSKVLWNQKNVCRVREGDIDEYNLSLNLAKYGLKYTGITWEDWQRYYFVHIGTGDREAAVKIARNVLETWNEQSDPL